MKVCVTGAAGFVGQHVVKGLKKNGCWVVGLDRAEQPNSDADEWLGFDITNKLPNLPHIDAVVHLAAVANPRECDQDPVKAFNVNVNGTHQVLKMALESRAKKVVFSSTGHVYGISPRYFPTDESHPLWLQNTYTLTKILGEQLCQLYHENHGLSYTALRFFNIYGAVQPPGYFIPDMMEKARGGNLVLPGGNTTKDWVYIDDAVQAVVLALGNPYVGPVNIGTGKETRLSDIASWIAEYFNASFISTDSPAATRMQADHSRASNVLVWQPKMDIREGLRLALKPPARLEKKLQRV